jgi:hypothetical protein
METKRPKKTEIESWLTTLRDRDGLTREHARERLVTLGPTATPFLLPLLSDHESQTRWEAAKALSEIADPASITALLDTLVDEDNDVSWLAAEALIAIGPPVAVPLLQALIERIGSVEFRQGVHHVLRELRRSEIGNKIANVYTALGSTASEVEVIVDAERALEKLKSAG